jgi:hypothetical protein
MLATLDAARPRVSGIMGWLLMLAAVWIVLAYRVGYDTGHLDGHIEGWQSCLQR